MSSVRSKLRDRLTRGETIVAPGAYDPIGTRIVQELVSLPEYHQVEAETTEREQRR